MADYIEALSCALCDSDKLSVELDLGHTALANELDGAELFPLVVNKCGDCGHHQLSIFVKPDRLWGPNYPYQSGTSPAFRKHLAELADEIAARFPGGRVLEIGSNDGTLLDLLKQRGLEALGVDPSGADRPDTIREPWPLRARDIQEPVDCIVALNVFAHVDDLRGFAGAMGAALAPGGRIVIEVADARQMAERGIFDTVYHEHKHYHSWGPLVRFFRSLGFYAAGYAENLSQGGSMRIWFADDGVMRPEPFVFGDSLRRSIKQAEDCIYAACVEHSYVAGFGAPAKLATMARVAMRWDIDGIHTVYDDNPLKVGHLVPGTDWRIKPTSELLADNPDALILFSWNFADEIIPRLRAMGYEGEIINPMEHVR